MWHVLNCYAGIGKIRSQITPLYLPCLSYFPSFLMPFTANTAGPAWELFLFLTFPTIKQNNYNYFPFHDCHRARNKTSLYKNVEYC